MSHHYINRPAIKRLNEPVPHTAYQVDFGAKNCGKIVPASKRVIRFKFGYSNRDALATGKTGQDCRGSEHEVLITWSLSSGKQAIAFDQQEVYFDVGDTTQSKISHAWKDKTGRTLKVKVHATNMSTKSDPDPYWKQYDLLIDGVSFFRMPKIFELGTVSREVQGSLEMVPSRFNQSVPVSMEFSMPATSEDNTDEPIEAHMPEPETPAVVDLLSFDDVDAPAPTIHQEVPVQVESDFAISQAPAQPIYNNYLLPQAHMHADNYANPEFQHALAPAHYQQSHLSNTNHFLAQANPFENPPAQPAAIAASTNPFQNAPVYSATASTHPFEFSQIQNSPSNSFAAPVNSADTSPAQYNTPNQVHGTPGYQASFYQASNTYDDPTYVSPNPTALYQPQPNFVTPLAASTLHQTQSTSTAHSHGIDAAVNKLVNFDNLLSSASSSAKATTSCVNSHTSIGQLQGNQKNTNQKKCVMNPFDAAPVYHHSQQQQQQQQQVFNKFATQRPLYNNNAQQAYAQSGFGY